jgi:hypothetical protein
MANTTYTVAGIVMLLFGLTAALWGYLTDQKCKSLIGLFGQVVDPQLRTQCQYTETAIVVGVLFAALGLILTIGGFLTKPEEEEM